MKENRLQSRFNIHAKKHLVFLRLGVEPHIQTVLETGLLK